MASPFPKYIELGASAKIREGITLRDFRKDRPDGKMYGAPPPHDSTTSRVEPSPHARITDICLW